MAAVDMINKGSTRNALIIQRFHRLFWLSATYNFTLKAFYIPSVDNTIVDHASRLDEPSHFTAFLAFLQSGLASSPNTISS